MIGKNLRNPQTILDSLRQLQNSKTGCLAPQTLQNWTKHPLSGFGRWFCHRGTHVYATSHNTWRGTHLSAPSLFSSLPSRVQCRPSYAAAARAREPQEPSPVPGVGGGRCRRLSSSPARRRPCAQPQRWRFLPRRRGAQSPDSGGVGSAARLRQSRGSTARLRQRRPPEPGSGNSSFG